MSKPRIEKLIASLAEVEADSVIVTSAINVRYLTGFTGSNALLTVTKEGDATLFTDPRYTIQAGREFAGRVRTIRSKHLWESAMVQLKKRRQIAFENKRMTVAIHDAMKEKLTLGMTLVPLGAKIEDQRMVKDEAEQAAIRKSCALNSSAFDKSIKLIRPGMSELDLVAEIDHQMRLLGAEKPAFETIVAAGPNSALPHIRPGNARFRDNEVLLIDMGAFGAGYASDMTRMVALGRPAAEIREMYKAVLEAHMAAVDAVRPGVSAQRVDQVARDVLKARGLEKTFVHSTGHGLGLEIHEPPRLGKKEKTKLAAGMTITIEPGAYVEGRGGIRIEDTLLVTGTGCESLTPTSKEFVVL